MREVLGRKKYFFYALLFTVYWIIQSVLLESFSKHNKVWEIGIWTIPLDVCIAWIVLVASFQATITKDWFYGFSIKDKFKFQIKRMRYEKTKTEMELLKMQLSPHFYKNLLTNIQALVESKKAEAPDAIVSLKELMEYMLYDTAALQKVELHKEIEFITKLIDIRRLGLKNQSQINLIIQVAEKYKSKQIIPFALLPFIENVFSHCDFNTENAYAKIRLSTNEEGKLIYFVENTTPENQSNHNRGGLGIKNLTARLDEYHKNRYELKLQDKNGIFYSKLEIKLK
jgi:two-component system LytT family sensor kinase